MIPGSAPYVRNGCTSPKALCQGLRPAAMQSSDEADNSSAPKARAKPAKGFRGARSWGLRIPKKGSAEAEDAAEAEAVVADQGSKSMTEGSTRSACISALSHDLCLVTSVADV